MTFLNKHLQLIKTQNVKQFFLNIGEISFNWKVLFFIYVKIWF